MDPNPILVSLLKIGNLETDIYTRKTTCEDEGKALVDVSLSQGTQKTASKLPEARRVME